MKYLKNILAIIFIIVGAGTLVAYVSGVFSKGMPIGANFSIEFWGIFSALFLFIGGFLVLKNNLVSMWFLIASILTYFLGAVVPGLSKYGVNTFEFIINDFYGSLLTRVALAIVAIYALRKVIAANKALQPTPKSGAAEL